ncbi:MAG: hypothetical protein AAB588_05400, partial [Patescibacteria group bacterium]
MKTSFYRRAISFFAIISLLVGALFAPVFFADSTDAAIGASKTFSVGSVTKDPKHSVIAPIPNTGGMMQINTKEGYRVSLHVPKGSATTQNITLSALKTNPFKIGKKSFKGNGIFVEPQYRNLSGRYFYYPAWLVFDFDPKEPQADRTKPVDYCRADLSTFNLSQCQNSKGDGYSSDDLFMIYFDPEDKTDVRLAPVYRISSKNVYAAEVLYKG